MKPGALASHSHLSSCAPLLPPFFSPRHQSLLPSLPPSDVFPRSLSARPSAPSVGLLSALPRFVRIYLTDIFHGWLATTNPRGSEAHNVSRIHVDRRPSDPSFPRPSVRVRPSVGCPALSLARSLSLPLPWKRNERRGEYSLGRAGGERDRRKVEGVIWGNLSVFPFPDSLFQGDDVFLSLFITQSTKN